MKTTRSVMLVCIAALYSCFASCTERSVFYNQQITLEGAVYPYSVYIPARNKSEQKLPVILFLHGAGERGSDGIAQTTVGLGPVLSRSQGTFPAIVVLPQCPRGAWWTEPTMERMALAVLDEAVRQHGGDTKRLYATGISMGGYGIWSVAANHPGIFAAIVPICGGIITPADIPIPAVSTAPDPYRDTARRIAHTPVWMFHGANDNVISASESREMANALRETDTETRYTEYIGLGHQCWDRAYAESNLYRWLLVHHL